MLFLVEQGEYPVGLAITASPTSTDRIIHASTSEADLEACYARLTATTKLAIAL